jgi:hypothetical protein
VAQIKTRHQKATKNRHLGVKAIYRKYTMLQLARACEPQSQNKYQTHFLRAILNITDGGEESY